MDNPKFTQLHIEVSVSHATEDDIDRMTRQLLAELRETDIESAELAKDGYTPRGAKSGDPTAIGSIVISALPSVLPTVVALVQSWIARGQGRTVKFRGRVGGEMIEFEGPSEELRKLLETLEKGKKKKK